MTFSFSSAGFLCLSVCTIKLRHNQSFCFIIFIPLQICFIFACFPFPTLFNIYFILSLFHCHCLCLCVFFMVIVVFFCFPLKCSPNNASAIVFFSGFICYISVLCMHSCNWVAVSHSIVFVLCKGGSANNLFLQTSNSRYGVKLCQIFVCLSLLSSVNQLRGFRNISF